MTARPLVFHVVRNRLQKKQNKNNEDCEGSKSDWRYGLSPTTVTVIDTCVSTARNTITICAAAAKQNLFGK